MLWMYFPHHWVTAAIKDLMVQGRAFMSHKSLFQPRHHSIYNHSSLIHSKKAGVRWPFYEQRMKKYYTAIFPPCFRGERGRWFLLTFHSRILFGCLCSSSALCHPWTICRMAGGSLRSLHISKRSLCPLLHLDFSVSSVLEGQLQREENEQADIIKPSAYE